MGCYNPTPLKEISSQDLRKERGSKEGSNEYDECLHDKIVDKDKWEDTGEALLSYPVSRKRERSLHTCAQDVQITRMATI
jgi:hypothetical protein